MYIEGPHVVISKIRIIFLSLKIGFVSANSVDPDGTSSAEFLMVACAKRIKFA